MDELVRIPTRLVVRESCGCLPGIPASIKDEAVAMQKPPEITRAASCLTTDPGDDRSSSQ